MHEEFLPIDEQRKWFLEIESLHGEDTEVAMKTIEMTTKDLEYYIKLVDKAKAGFERTLGVGDGQGGLACCDSWDRKESDTTE